MSNTCTRNSRVVTEEKLHSKVSDWLLLFIASTDPVADGLVTHPEYGLCSNTLRNASTLGEYDRGDVYYLLGRMSGYVKAVNPDKYGTSAYPILDMGANGLTSREQYHSGTPLYEGEQLRLRKAFAQDVADCLRKFNLVKLGFMSQEEYDSE